MPDELSQKNFPTGGGADCGPIRLPGTPPVFLLRHQKEIQPMTKNSAHNGKPHPDDDGPKKKDRIDVNPPFSERLPSAVERFWIVLAQLIARRIVSKRRDLPNSETE